MAQYKLQAQIRATEPKEIADALAEAQEWVAKEGGRILTAPEVELVILGDDVNGEFGAGRFTSTTEELIGRTIGGAGVVLYGSNILLGTPQRIRDAVNRGVTKIGAGIFDPNEFNAVLSGKRPEGKDLQVYDIKDLIRYEDLQPVGAVIRMDLADAIQSKSGHCTIDSLLENHRFIARAGGMPKAREIVRAAINAGYSEDTVTGDYAWALNNVNLEEGAQGLFVGVHTMHAYIFSDLDRPDNLGSFIWVAPEKVLVAQNSDTSSKKLRALTDLQRAIEIERIVSSAGGL